MGRSLTFGQQIIASLAVMVVFAVLIGAVSIHTLHAVIREKDRVISVNAQNVILAQELKALTEARQSGGRGYLLAKEEDLLQQVSDSRDRFRTTLQRMSSQGRSPEERQALAKIEEASSNQSTVMNRLFELRKTDAPLESVASSWKAELLPIYHELIGAIRAFLKLEQQSLEDSKLAATESAFRAILLVAGIAIAGMAVAAILAFVLSRLLRRQIGSAVQHIQTSSSQLQAAANQQTTGSKEQVTSMNEISTTIKELVSTARQIAESAQRVSHIAEETEGSARTGELTLQKTRSAIVGMQSQVGQIVEHMLDLGRKSQQIGGVLELINELAEQTNILAINATIEAAGAGESGKRFAVVADEIRKLADRVGSSTKEIRTLIEEIRSAVNTTVMATESGSKSVEAGARQFGDVAEAFKQITGLVGTTNEAAREIELSTKQQTTAVEQVNVAIANTTQAAKESETSSTQTLQTASELTSLSRGLARLIQAVPETK